MGRRAGLIKVLARPERALRPVRRKRTRLCRLSCGRRIRTRPQNTAEAAIRLYKDAPAGMRRKVVGLRHRRSLAEWDCLWPWSAISLAALGVVICPGCFVIFEVAGVEECGLETVQD